jgi:hypothetical protein
MIRKVPPSTAAIEAFDDVSESTRVRIWHGRQPFPLRRFIKVMKAMKVPRQDWPRWLDVFNGRREEHCGER